MKIKNLIFIVFFSILLGDNINFLSGTMGIAFDATYFHGSLKIIALIALIRLWQGLRIKKMIPRRAYDLFCLLMVINILTLVRGTILANDYWDWKFLILGNFFALITPLFLLIGLRFSQSELLQKFVLKRIFVFGYLLIPITAVLDPQHEFYSWCLLIYSWFYIIISPYLDSKWRIIIIVASIVSFLIPYDFRANMFRIGFASFLFVMYYFKNHIKRSWMSIAASLIFITPFLFLFLGLTGQYNVFKDSGDDFSYKHLENGVEYNLATDTRTFLYVEVLSSLKENNSFIFGEGGIASYKSDAFSNNDFIAAHGRNGSEVGALNTLLYSGIVGLVIYMMVLAYAVYLAVSKSNNFLCRLFGLFIAFSWVMFFVEDIIKFDLNNLFLWITIGLCFSNKFRRLTDVEIILFFRQLLSNTSVVKEPEYL